MIEKLNPTELYRVPNAYIADLKIVEKLNEIIDALNRLEQWQGSNEMARAPSNSPDR